MEKGYYDATSLERVLDSFEREYGISSAHFYEHHLADEPIAGMSNFHRHVWASFYRDVQRLRNRDFATNAERVLAFAT